MTAFSQAQRSAQAGTGAGPRRSGADPSRGFHLVVVANRLPVEVDPTAGQGWRRSVGGLVTALEPVLRRSDAAWIGWSGGSVPGAEPFAAHGLHLVPVELSGPEREDFYEGFSNGTLWPLYHDAVVRPRFEDRWWCAYRHVNARYAAAAAASAAPGATVWLHDYQLQLAPALLRAARPDVAIGYFHHIPFPGPDILAQLPWRREVLEGLVGADLVGFQRRTDAVNFALACRRWVPDGRRVELAGLPDGSPDPAPPDPVRARPVRVGVFPISIDVAAFDAVARRPEVQARAREIRAQLGDPRRIVLGVDRLDYTKGILQRLRAYQRLLERGLAGPPETVFVQVATPSRERVDQYRELLGEVEALAGQINGEFATLSQPAVRYLHHAYPRVEIVALYLAADVLLVTSLKDGMNLVAKEFIASRVDDGGALVLSEFAGAADELGEAFVVNPYDGTALQETIREALQAPAADLARRMRTLRRTVRDHDVQQWARSFLDALWCRGVHTRVSG